MISSGGWANADRKRSLKKHTFGLLSRAPSRFAAVALVMCLATPQMALAEDYRLGPQDKLNIRVAEW